MTDINMKESFLESRNVHRTYASNELKFNRYMYRSVRDNPSSVIQLVFDFVEKYFYLTY